MDDCGVADTRDGDHVMLWERDGAVVKFSLMLKEDR